MTTLPPHPSDCRCSPTGRHELASCRPAAAPPEAIPGTVGHWLEVECRHCGQVAAALLRDIAIHWR